MSIKLIAADIDGTLVTDDKRLLPETEKSIMSFQESGGIFVIASGRPIKGILRYIEKLNLKDYGGFVIAYNGSFILDIGNSSSVISHYIDVETAKQVIRTADKYNMNITTYYDDKAITQRAADQYFMLETSINLLERKYVESLVDFVDFPVPKFLITGDGDLLEKYEKIMKSELDNVNIFRSEPFFLEIVPKSVDKGISFDYLRKYLKLRKDETMAIGDGFNDVSMIKYAGLGIAMKNSREPVIECADYITCSNNENGVGEAIEKFAL